MHVQKLLGMLKTNQIARTILLSGPFSSGKTTFARIIARYVNCETSGPKKACLSCGSCVSLETGTHPDVLELDAATNRGIDQIRALIDQSQFAPLNRYRVFILDECHALTPNAVQALLKTLEEPPKSTIFILCTTNPGALPKTILSRCQWLKLQQIKPDVCASYIQAVAVQEQFPLSQENAITLAKYAYGSPRDALHLLENFIHYVAGSSEGKDINVEEILPKLQRSLQLPPAMLADRYTEYLLKGSGNSMVKLLDSVDNAAVFFQKVCDLLRGILECQISPSASSSYYEEWFASKEWPRNLLPEMMLEVFKEHMEGLEKASNYTSSPRDLVSYVALKSLFIIRKCPKSNHGGKG